MKSKAGSSGSAGRNLAGKISEKIDDVLKRDYVRQKQLCNKTYASVSGLIHVTVLLPDCWLPEISKTVAEEFERLYAKNGKNVRFNIFYRASGNRGFCVWFLNKENNAEFGVRLFGERYFSGLIKKLGKRTAIGLKKRKNSTLHVPVSSDELFDLTPLALAEVAGLFKGEKWKSVGSRISISDFGDAFPKLYLETKNRQFCIISQ